MISGTPRLPFLPYTTLFRSARVEIAALRNEDYLVLVDGVDGARGAIQVKWNGEEQRSTVELQNGQLTVELRAPPGTYDRSEEHTSELQSLIPLVCRPLLQTH